MLFNRIPKDDWIDATKWQKIVHMDAYLGIVSVIAWFFNDWVLFGVLMLGSIISVLLMVIPSKDGDYSHRPQEWKAVACSMTGIFIGSATVVGALLNKQGYFIDPIPLCDLSWLRLK